MEHNDKSTINERVKQARQSVGLTQKQMASELGIERDAYKMYEYNVRLSDETAVRFCEITGVELLWLKFNIGPMHKEENSFTTVEEDIIKAYRNAPDHQKKTILDILDINSREWDLRQDADHTRTTPQPGYKTLHDKTPLAGDYKSDK